MEPFPDELNRKLKLSPWILRFDKHLLTNHKFYENVKEYFFESYRSKAKLRKVFHNQFLPELDNNLGFPSSPEYYKYEYFFKTQNYPKFDLAGFYYYDEDINLFKKDKSLPNLKTEETDYSNIDDYSENQNDISEKNINNNKNQNNINIKLKNNKDNNQLRGEKNNSEKKYRDEEEIISSEIKNNINLKRQKSNKNESNYSSRVVSSKRFDNININIGSNDNLETYGKEIEDSDENSENKSKVSGSKKSLQKYNEKNKKEEINKNNFKKNE